MKKIKLTKSKCALVDDRYFDWLNQWKWHYLATGYAAHRNWKTSEYILMHRLIMKAPTGVIVDHIDRNPLNNQRKNLRITTKSKNGLNCKLSKNNTSGFTGVGIMKTGKWRARIMVDRYEIHLGCFKTKKEAIRVRKAVLQQYL